MKRIFFLLLITFLFCCSPFKNYAQQCADCRYVSPIFDSVTMETVQFGRGVRANGDTQQLYMDIYQPFGDTATSRPVALFAFGGAFITGSRDDWYVKLVCEHLAKAGYVTVSIDYRIYDDIQQMVGEIFGAFPTQQMRIFFRPMQDMRGAVQYMKADYSELGNNYRIDTNKILIGGASSGAITSLMTAYCDKESELAEMGGGSTTPINALGGFNSSTGFYPNYSWHAAATFNVAGALINANWIEPGDVPVICAHGDADQVVPYKKGGFAGLTLGTFDMEGSYLVDSVARAKGVCSYLYTMEGRDHPSESMGVEYFYSVVYRMALRMKAVISNKSFCCPLKVDVTPNDTLFYGLNPTQATLNAVVTNDGGNAQVNWCTMPCHGTATGNTFSVTVDSTWRYVAATASEGACLSSNLHIVYDTAYIAMGIKENEPAFNFSIYPQPASNQLSIEADLSSYRDKNGTLELKDVTGKTLYAKPIGTGNGPLKTSIDVSSYAAGTYLLQLSVNGVAPVARRILLSK